MSSTTPRVGFYMPADDGSEPIDVATDLNDNLEKIDSSIGFVPSTAASPPATPYDGMATYETDTGRAKFRKAGAGTWAYLLTAGAEFIGNIVLNTASRIGIGISTPAAIMDFVLSNITSVPILKVKQASESFHRVQFDYDGIRFGPGNVGTDTRIYRQAAATLAITGAVSMESSLSVTGALTASSANVSGDLNVDGNVVGDFNVTGTFSGTGIGVTRIVRKTADTSRTSTTTMANDPDLTFSVDGSSTYLVELILVYSGDAAGDFKSNWSLPSNASANMWILGQPTSQPERDTTTMRTGVHTATGDVTLGCTGPTWWNGASMTMYLITDSSGTVTLRWAQNASNATATIIRAGSLIKITKLA